MFGWKRRYNELKKETKRIQERLAIVEFRQENKPKFKKSEIIKDKIITEILLDYYYYCMLSGGEIKAPIGYKYQVTDTKTGDVFVYSEEELLKHEL